MPLESPQQHPPRYQNLLYAFAPKVYKQMRRYSHAQQLTLNTLLQGSWGLLLLRYSGEQSVLFGTTVSGRNIALEGITEMVGLFIHTLPVRVHTHTGGSVAFLQGIQQQQQNSNLYLPSALTDIQTYSEISAGTALFESLLVFENQPMDDALWQPDSPLTITEMTTEEGSHYPLTLAILPGDRLTIKLRYDHTRFTQPQMIRMLGHLEKLMDGLVRKPAQTITTLPMLLLEEQQQLQQWNATDTPYPTHQTLTQLFETQVKKTPKATALIYRDQSLSYQELHHQANHLAGHLHSVGIGVGERVAICQVRCPKRIVSLLAILKVGAIYVPLDPEDPPARLTALLKEAEVTALLKHKSTPVLLLPTTILIIEVNHLLPKSELPPPTSVQAQEPACLFYTSGSTGQPKGVLVSHRNIVRLVKNTHYLDFGPHQVFLHLAPLAFDASTFKIWGALLHGAFWWWFHPVCTH